MFESQSQCLSISSAQAQLTSRRKRRAGRAKRRRHWIRGVGGVFAEIVETENSNNTCYTHCYRVLGCWSFSIRINRLKMMILKILMKWKVITFFIYASINLRKTERVKFKIWLWFWLFIASNKDQERGLSHLWQRNVSYFSLILTGVRGAAKKILVP